MVKTWRIALSLKTTGRVNMFLYALTSLPLVGKKLPMERLYKNRPLKAAATVLSVLVELFGGMIRKIVYFYVALFLPFRYFAVDPSGQALHALIFLSTIGAIYNTRLFEAKRDKYYALVLLGMDDRQYTLSQYFFDLAQFFVCYAFGGLYFGGKLGLSLFYRSLIPFYIVAVKLCSAAFFLKLYQKKGYTPMKNNTVFWAWISIVTLFCLAYLPLLFSYRMPKAVYAVVMGLTMVGGACGLAVVLRFPDFRCLYRYLLQNFIDRDDAGNSSLFRMQYLGVISENTVIESRRKGFEYLNELFVKRHKKILWQSSRRISVIAALLLAAMGVGEFFVPEMVLARDVEYFLPKFIFVMYAINRGMGYTRALFVNCDRSLLSYSFFREPRRVVKLFCIRLRELIKINLLPAAVIGVGWTCLMLLAGAERNAELLIPLISLVSLSVFFSVHYLTIYYLLQPYSADTDVKSPLYTAVQLLTYVACALMMEVELPMRAFALLTVGCSPLYCLIACALVYFLSPKTFKLRD